MVFNEIMYVGTFEMFSEEYGKYAPWFNSGKRSTQLAFMQFPITTTSVGEMYAGDICMFTIYSTDDIRCSRLMYKGFLLA